jgi:hypothetical protein
MAMNPVTLRLDKRSLSLLSEGTRRTKLNKGELIRRTLRNYLPEVIEQEAAPVERVTAVSPWPRGALAKAYRRANRDWDRVEAAATTAQGKPAWGD